MSGSLWWGLKGCFQGCLIPYNFKKYRARDPRMAASHELAVLLVTPMGRDAELAASVLRESGIQSEALHDVGSAAQALNSRNFGALLIAEEAFGTEGIAL